MRSKIKVKSICNIRVLEEKDGWIKRCDVTILAITGNDVPHEYLSVKMNFDTKRQSNGFFNSDNPEKMLEMAINSLIPKED